jgi:hypothetical protein
MLPTADMIMRSEKPMLRWVRRGMSQLLDPSTLYSHDKRDHFYALALKYFQRDDVRISSLVIEDLMNRRYAASAIGWM